MTSMALSDMHMRINFTAFYLLQFDVIQLTNVMSGNNNFTLQLGSHDPVEDWRSDRGIAVQTLMLVFAAIGVATNTLTITAILYKLRKHAKFVPIIFLSLANLAVIGLNTFRLICVYNHSLNVATNPVACKVFQFTWHWSNQLQSWYIVFLALSTFHRNCLEYRRCLGLDLRDGNGRRGMRGAVLLICIAIAFVLAAVNAPLLHFAKYLLLPIGTHGHHKCLLTKAFNSPWAKVHASLTCYIPYLIVVPSFSCVIMSFAKLSRRQNPTAQHRIRSYTKALLVLILCFVIFSLPHNVVFFHFSNTQLAAHLGALGAAILEDITRLMVLSNYALTLVYLWSVEVFRNAVRDTIVRCLPPRLAIKVQGYRRPSQMNTSRKASFLRFRKFSHPTTLTSLPHA